MSDAATIDIECRRANLQPRPEAPLHPERALCNDRYIRYDPSSAQSFGKLEGPGPMDRRTVGIVGLTPPGSAVAERLLRRGCEVIGFDTDEASCAALANLNGTVALSAEQVFAESARVLLCLADANATARLLDDIGAVVGGGHIVIDTTADEPEQITTRGQLLAARDVGYLDAAISGSPQQTRAGVVTVTVGGPAETFAECEDLFEAFSAHWFHVGPLGSGLRMKWIGELVQGLHRAALAEGLALARGFGLDLEQTLRVLRSGAAFSLAMEAKGPKMVDEDFDVQDPLVGHLEDLALILDSVGSTDVELPLAQTLRTLLERAADAGFADADTAAIIKAYTEPGPEPRNESDDTSQP